MGFLKPNIDKLSSKKNVKGLLRALTYKEKSEIRGDAARELGFMGDLKAVEPLLLALKDEDKFVIKPPKLLEVLRHRGLKAS